MEKKIIITKRFRNNTLRVYQYLLKEFSAKSAYDFLNRLEKRIVFIAENPAIGKASAKKRISAAFYLLRITRYFIAIRIISLKYFACLICEKIRRSDPIEFFTPRVCPHHSLLLQ